MQPNKTTNTRKTVLSSPWIISNSIFAVVISLIAVSCMTKTNNSEEIRVFDEEADTIVVEVSPVLADVGEKTMDRSVMSDTYIQILDKHLRANNENGFFKCEYFLYDITGNGTPELWVKSGTCEADYMLYIYTNDNNLKKIYEGGADHSCFYACKGYVIQMCAHMGFSTWYKITYDGTVKVAEVWNEHTDDDYRCPSGSYIEMTQYE